MNLMAFGEEKPVRVIPDPKHEPERGSDVEAWLKAHRDFWRDKCDSRYSVLDELLDEYRLRADYGRSLLDDVKGLD